MPTFLIYLAIILPAILIGLGIALYVFQERLIFYPDKLSVKAQFKFDNEFEEYFIETKDGEKINALKFKAKTPIKGVVFYNHGNAGSLEYWGTKAIDFTSRGYDVLMYDYRGFGKSSGKIKNEKMLYNDAKMLYKKLLHDYAEKDVVIYGISLGTGVATKLAHENQPKLLILETPYFNFYDVSKHHYPYLPTSILLHYQFRNNKLLPELKIPVYLFHGTVDKTVPYDSSVRLEKLAKHIHLFTIENGSHSDLNTFNYYHHKLDEILN
ncbi:MAG: alpha/beta fold hydrolase [Flavobacteriales bacterium]|nr:alpha/beta fold hydrolase [Flavobacteriales bacterium]